LAGVWRAPDGLGLVRPKACANAQAAPAVTGWISVASGGHSVPSAERPATTMPRLLRSLDTPRGNNLELCPRTQHEDPFLGMVATTEARGTMRSYLKIVLLIVGLVGAYLALLPLIV